MDVYLGMCAQLWQATKDHPDGTAIDDVSIQDQE